MSLAADCVIRKCFFLQNWDGQISKTPKFYCLFWYKFKTKISQKFSRRVPEALLFRTFQKQSFCKGCRRKEQSVSIFLFIILCLQGFEGIFECVFLILPYNPPKGENPCKWASKNTFKQPFRHYKIRCLRAFRSYFCPNRSYSKQHLGPNSEGLLRIGPKDPKIGPKMLSNALFYSVWGVA